MKITGLFRWAVGLAMLGAAAAGYAGSGTLQIRSGYFWDPTRGDYFLPRGFGYQTWNSAVGADQTPAQIDYDFAEMRRLHCNSVRCEMVWSEVETAPGVYDWSKPDLLVQMARKHGFKLFVLIGFQYAPQWFPASWRAVDDHGGESVVLNYEHPEARRAYSNYIHQVTARYREAREIGGWILGNEYAYFDLWNTSHYNLGFDAYSLASYRRFLQEIYGGDIAALRANWGTNYASFDVIPMPARFPANRLSPAYHDLIRWRELSIGDYVAVGARAARLADPDHLRTYSMVGGLFIGADANYTCEDAKTIVERCAAAGAPLDFWAINNYAWATLVAELRSGDFGISKHLAQSGLPVLISETGHSTIDNLLEGAAARQPDAVPGSMWEALICGAIGIHIFTWNDREMFGGDFIRERGFGVVNENRTPKSPAFEKVALLFRQMEALQLERLLPGSADPPHDLEFFWGNAAKMGWPRANQENAMLWGVLKRLGYQPGLLDDAAFDRDAYTNAAALVLSRCYKMEPRQLERIRTNTLTRGLHLWAEADLPGELDVYDRPNPAWAGTMQSLFGIDVSAARVAFDQGVVLPTGYAALAVRGTSALGGLTNGYVDRALVWKIWHGIAATDGQVAATHTGYQASQPALPALVIRTNPAGGGRSALTTFALCDLFRDDTQPPTHDWDFRRRWVQAICRDHFGLTPAIALEGTNGAAYVIPDYRICANGSVLVSLLNGLPTAADVLVRAPGLFTGRTVEHLTQGGVLETNSDGAVRVALAPDEFALLYAYRAGTEGDISLLNPQPDKLWFASAPEIVWPRDTAYALQFGYHTASPGGQLVLSLERLSWPPAILRQTAPLAVSGGPATANLELAVPDADLNDAAALSTAEGGQYRWRARLLRGGSTVAEIVLPVRLAWGVKPLAPLPATVAAGQRVEADLKWEELPSYEAWGAGRPLDRAALWETYQAGLQAYAVVLELRDSQGNWLAQGLQLTRSGSGTARVVVQAPQSYAGPVQWLAYVRPAPGATPEFLDDFEHRGPGEIKDVPDALRPWNVIYSYSDPTGAPAVYLNRGVGMGQPPFLLQGLQYGFLVYTNPPGVGAYSGFGMVHDFPAPWSLPGDLALWSNYTVSARVRLVDPQNQRLPGVIELQLNDALTIPAPENGGQLRYTQAYPSPDTTADGWMPIRATLDQFQVTPARGFFSPAQVASLVFNVQMTAKGQLYVAHVDDVQLAAPLGPPPSGASRDFVDSFEDRKPGASDGSSDPLAPWGTYTYPDTAAKPVLWAQGVQTRATAGGEPASQAINQLALQPQRACEGLQSAFLLVTNLPSAGTNAGFGMYYVFPQEWALPANPALWTQYTFGFKFRDAARRACFIEMQVKSAPGNWMEFGKRYQPDASGWDTVSARLSDFTTPPGVGAFDPQHVQTLVVNVRMLEPGALYDAAVDAVAFEGPEVPLPPETGYGVYRSAPYVPDRDQDGLADACETGTHVYHDPCDTGTDPLNPDSDGDGMRDGVEVALGFDPNDPASVFRLLSVQRLAPDTIRLLWPTIAGWEYTVEAADGASLPDNDFLPLPGLIRIPGAPGGLLEAVDHYPEGSPARYYRVVAAPAL